jgi:hypothetical protein
MVRRKQRRAVEHWSPNGAAAFIDHSSEMWNFGH